MNIWDILTDPLTRHYFLEEWYKGTQGIVEYLGEWVRESTSLVDTKKLGVAITIVILVTLAVKGIDFLRQPAKGETIWDVLFKHKDNE